MFLRHWAGHRVSALWALHSVHHQSRKYNLSVAGRLAAFSDTLLFAIPCAVLGFPTEMVLGWFLVGNAWMFFQHTQLVGRIRWLDGLIMTPANHRVHHGCNPRYLDRNYGNILLWDRLTGTWQPEVEPVRYGVLTGLRTYDGTENNLEPLRLLWRRFRRTAGWRNRAWVLFGPPGWVPGRGEVEPTMVDDPEPQRLAPIDSSVRVAATALVMMAGALAVPLIALAGTLAWPVRFAWLALVVLLLAVGGVVLDARLVDVTPNGDVGPVRARAASWVLTLAGREAEGPLRRIGRWLAGTAIIDGGRRMI
jgi:sterol desaturase/sphingolipid hydroxylase (fatty acid hydroxylase superfamily)